MSFQTGKHVWYVPGAGEAAVLVHYLRDNHDGTQAIQPPGGGEVSVPRREPKGGEYVSDPSAEGYEDLGQTWHTVRSDDSPRGDVDVDADEDATAIE